MRDDFTPATKRLLAERAGYICSNPTCRRNQLGPAPGASSKSVNLGKAAHICAAAAGGPRYNELQTAAQRSSIDNGIFLCGGCADLIDKNNGIAHPAEMLLGWKETHINWVQERLNMGDLDGGSFEGVVWQEISSAVGAVGQAQTVNIIQSGISYTDARDIALDVYRANYLTLSENAAQIARKRAEELTDEFLAELQKRNAEAIVSLETPGMQHALFSAQKEYARTGDNDLESLLVDILVDRAAAMDRNIRQIVLDEALSVAPKLTSEQMDALTVNFLIVRTENHAINSLETFASYLDSHIAPFIGSLATDTSCYEHLEYTGCGSISLIGNLHPIGELYLQRYHGLFVKGFEEEEWKKQLADSPDLIQWAVTKCLHDPSKLQINAINEPVLNEQCQKYGVSDDDKTKLIQLFNLSRMSHNEVKDYILRLRPNLQSLFEVWEKSRMSQLTLTTVGIAVAHANFRRKTGIQLDLNIWVK